MIKKYNLDLNEIKLKCRSGRYLKVSAACLGELKCLPGRPLPNVRILEPFLLFKRGICKYDPSQSIKDNIRFDL